jgi:hypothetical protein
MNSLWYQKTGYPVGFIPIELGNAVYAVCAMTKAPVELVAPVVLASAAAAVQGVSDVQKPCSGAIGGAQDLRFEPGDGDV